MRYFDSQGHWLSQGATAGATSTERVWGIGYVNDIILRDWNKDANAATGSYGRSGSGLEQRLYAQDDANHDVTSIMTPGQAVAERFLYDPHGVTFTLSGAWVTYVDATYYWVTKWQGEAYEATASLYLMEARVYSVGLGRFLQRDPIMYADGMNDYQAMGGNPVSRVDPSGLTFDWYYTPPSNPADDGLPIIRDMLDESTKHFLNNDGKVEDRDYFTPPSDNFLPSQDWTPGGPSATTIEGPLGPSGGNPTFNDTPIKPDYQAPEFESPNPSWFRGPVNPDNSEQPPTPTEQNPPKSLPPDDDTKSWFQNFLNFLDAPPLDCPIDIGPFIPKFFFPESPPLYPGQRA